MEDVGIFYGHSVNFPAINGHLVYFVVIWYVFPFWYVVPKKSGNPAHSYPFGGKMASSLGQTRSAKNFIRNAIKTKALLQMIQDGDVEPTLRLLNLQLHRQLCCRLERFSKYIKENFF
jgi:hypothetical protein